MAIFFSSLFADVPGWVARDDIANSLAGFIRAAEPEIYRRVRIMEMEVNADFVMTAASNYAEPLPEEWLKFRFVYNTSTSDPRCLFVTPDIFHTLNNITRDTFSALRGEYETLYTVEGGNLRVYAPPGSSENITLKTGYFEGYRFGGDYDNETCPVLSRHYDVYLSAVLMQAWDFVDEPAMVEKYERRLDKIAAQIGDQEANRRQTAGPVRRSTPKPGMIV